MVIQHFLDPLFLHDVNGFTDTHSSEYSGEYLWLERVWPSILIKIPLSNFVFRGKVNFGNCNQTRLTMDCVVLVVSRQITRISVENIWFVFLVGLTQIQHYITGIKTLFNSGIASSFREAFRNYSNLTRKVLMKYRQRLVEFLR